MQPDSNDIIYNSFQIDLLFIGQQLFDIFGLSELSFAAFFNVLATAWNIWTIIAFILSALLAVGVVYAYLTDIKLSDIETEMIRKQELLFQEMYGSGMRNTRLEDIRQHITTDNPNDWKLAIIEADVMLEQVLEQAGYAGGTIGEKLKSASPTSFQTLDDAWRAHKIRNQIAHGGPDFILTKKLAQETITQYMRVFQEFGAA